MKQTLAPIALTFLCTSLQAQISILSTDMPVIGDVITRYVDTIPPAGPGNSGALQLWDFSAATQDLIENTSVVDPATTPYGDSFGGSNLAMTNDAASYLYFSNGPASMDVDGTAGDPGLGVVITAQFNPSLTLHQFPRQYADGFTDVYGFESIADGSAFGVYQVRVRHHGIELDTTDGYGNITTPTGTYDCLRVKNISYSVDSIWTKIIAILPWTFITSITDTSVSYSWLAKETKLPVADLTVDSAGAPLRFTYSSIPPLSTGSVAMNTNGPELSLYPQPATDKVFVKWPDGAQITSATIMDPDGRIVKHVPRPASESWIDLSGIPTGTFLLRMEAHDGSTRTARLVHVDRP